MISGKPTSQALNLTRFLFVHGKSKRYVYNLMKVGKKCLFYFFKLFDVERTTNRSDYLTDLP